MHLGFPVRAAIAAGALTLLIAGARLLPDSDHQGGAIQPQGANAQQPHTPGEMTPEAQAEIERVVAEGRQLNLTARASTYDLALASTRCATFEGQRYCLGLGWTMKTQEEAAADLAAAATPAPTRTKPEQTGDLDALTAISARAELTSKARARAERAELTAAAKSVAKVWQIRHEFQGVELPPGFTADARQLDRKHPRKFKILSEKQVRPQTLSYYCGPATMQMIGWGWRDRRQGQALWADKLHTSSAGTGITDMVRVVNHNTGYDEPERAGDYIVLDISDFSYTQWWRLMKKHIHTYKAPVVLHPILVRKYFPYLDDDASGHFQVGRGYHRTKDGQKLLGYFEPWDQSRFDPTEPRIARTQWQSAYKSFRANQAHFQHNVGV